MILACASSAMMDAATLDSINGLADMDGVDRKPQSGSSLGLAWTSHGTSVAALPNVWLSDSVDDVHAYVAIGAALVGATLTEACLATSNRTGGRTFALVSINAAIVSLGALPGPMVR